MLIDEEKYKQFVQMVKIKQSIDKSIDMIYFKHCGIKRCAMINMETGEIFYDLKEV